MADEDLRWPAVTKDPGETRSVVLDAFGLCAQFWEPNEWYDTGDYAWPLGAVDGNAKGGGYVAECTTAGRSGFVEPNWDGVVDRTIDPNGQTLSRRDGSVTWTMRRLQLAGISEIESASVTDDAGITVSEPIVSEAHKLLVDYSGGTDGEDYEVQFQFVIGGRTRIGRQTVQARKK